MIKLLLLMLPKLQSNAQKKDKNNLILVKRKKTHDQNTSNYRTRNQKNYCNKFSLGKKHDYALFKESKIPILKNTKLIVDSGYQGIQKNHNNVLIPKKKTKKNPLNKEQKQYNRLVSKMRIIIENIFAILKKI
ncbi:transposase family protein [Spiroplasma poulsonii]|uniref:transposase family protein n=1 Tax=Spiroplasma poulsonii TaxID=2138 RepID=UPI003A5C8631